MELFFLFPLIGAAVSEELVCVLSKVVYASADGDFRVAEFIDARSAKRFRAQGRMAFSAKSDAKQRYRLIGQWENNPKYGETFVVAYSEAERPTETKGIAPYLANNVKGVGEMTAKKLVQHFHIKGIDDLVTLCRDEKERVFQFFGPKKVKQAEGIVQMMVMDEIFRSIMIFLHEHNIPPRFSKKIYEKYASSAIKNLMENPYRLISDFRRVGFLKADDIARKLGISKVSPFRLEAAFVYTLEVAQDEGHCCLPRDVLVERAAVCLGSKQDPTFHPQFVLEELRKIYKKNKENGTESFLIRELKACEAKEYAAKTAKVSFYLPEILRMEDEVAHYLSSFAALPDSMGDLQRKAIEDLESGKKNLKEIFPDLPWSKLSSEQKKAVELSLKSRLMILTGGPGCGKTFTLKAIYSLQRALKRKVALCAPTGLAAKRMTASIGKTAFTVHKLLGLGAKPQQEKENNVNVIEELEGEADSLKNVDTVIVDESSMLSLDLMHVLLSSLGWNRRLILVGDADQLPSVGAGNILRDLLASHVIPTARLTQIFRQSSESPIPVAARDIISGKKPAYTEIQYHARFVTPEAFAFVPCQQESFFDLLITFLKEIVPTVYCLDPVKECQILVPMRKTYVGQENINKILQQHLNPKSEEKEEYQLEKGGALFRLGDKVIQTKNNYQLDVFNGDLGYCKSILKTKEKIEIEIEFGDKSVKYEDDEISELQLCYAMTVHKSQGSEFPLCVIPMFGVYYTMLDRNLLYTALTRSSRYAIFFGEDWAIKKSIQNQNAVQRYTHLKDLLKIS